jgi:hypothetical protein
MKIWSYTAFEHDRDRPWIVTGTRRGTAELDENQNFWEWASEHWPAPRFRVELDPGQELIRPLTGHG